METNGNGLNGVKGEEESMQPQPPKQESWNKKIRKLRNLITVEPLVVCWILPACFLIAAMENIGLEKVCIFFVLKNSIKKKTKASF